jgi:tetratricopeptide (TPR) repeat protein
MDAGLPNNAVAVCKKVMRNLPDRNSIHLKMGQIRAAQGFITDARTSFVTYAERVQAAGDMDEAFRALIEFVRLAPDDYEMCMMLAGQLEQNQREDEALTQYVGAYRILQRKGLGTLAEAAAARVRKLDPQLDLEQAAADPFFSRGAGFGNETGGEGNGQTAGDRAEPEIIGPVDLPLMSFDDDEDTKPAEEAAAGAAEEAAAASAAQAAQDAAAQTAAAESAAEKEKAAEDAAAWAAEAAEAAEVAKAAEETAAKAAALRWRSSPDGGYVDLSAVLLGEEVRTEEKSTRFVVPYEEPTGDDQADFERMLAQFREKVSENIDANDAMAHYDLGTAYMEMGLLDEAISEFQVVLRGTSDHLGTYEMLGQTFLQKKEPEAALRSLNRGLDAPCEVEEERVGIYYYIGLAHETIGDKDTAVEYYDRVFALDINFADVTERLRALRS